MFDSTRSGNNGFHEHEKWMQMCALLTADGLTAQELDELNRHLETCPDCRQAAADFQKISRVGIPLLVGDAEPDIQEATQWPEARLKKRLLAAIDGENEERFVAGHAQAKSGLLAWRYPALLIFAMLIGAGGYFFGSRHQVQRPAPTFRAGTPFAASTFLASQIAGLTRQRDELVAKATREGERIDHLSAQLAEQTKLLARLKQDLERAQAASGQQVARISGLQDENASLRAQHEDAAHQLQESQASVASLRLELGRLRQERAVDLVESATMQKTIGDLSAQLHSSDAVVSEQKKFLASDRDIRELMGARDLLIADVSDVDKDGNSRGPFGRVFYTKNKSLIFYAFDLEKHPGIRNLKAFQAWGQKSAGKDDHPLNLGVFYMDNEASRRWVLKFDNPKLMEQVDAVFVTVEPKGGSDTPHGRQLLYAYLRTLPNHP